MPSTVPADARGRPPQAPAGCSRSCCASETLRNVVRVVTLLALDFAGLFAAIFTALMVKAVVRYDDWALGDARYDEAKSLIAFAYLVTALLFARSGLYAERAQRPGLPKIVSSLFQVTVVALIFARRQRRAVLELLHLLRHAVLRDRLRRLDPLGLREGHGRAPARRGLPPARAARRLRRSTSRTSRHALVDEVHAPVEMVGFISLTPRPGQRPALARAGSRTSPRCSTPSGSRRSSSPTPTSRRSQAVELVDQCHQRGVTVRIAPSTMEILVHRAEFVPGHVGAAVRAAPAGVRRLRLRGQAHVRLRRRARCCCSCSARCCC